LELDGGCYCELGMGILIRVFDCIVRIEGHETWRIEY
jgi:hypothetical protein